jgi:DNA mismatch repair protein MutL
MSQNMTHKIHRLDSAVINQIAAGEVVDRPAHMVKELCENSLDAGATEISINFLSGGRNITITDNGQGIAAQDLKLALARHATSKIATTDDIWQINSYGFRGEALASIGAVSELEIISRPRTSQDATGGVGAKIFCKYGEISEVEPTGADVGTTIVVKNLFQNVPARLKFLKSDAGENGAIKTQLKAMALANPAVSFRILQNGELIFYWPKANSALERVQQVLEQPEMFSGHAELEGYRADVIVSSPNVTIGHSRQIWLFVRGRYVQDRSLQAAVNEAYRNLLMHGEYPIAAVFLDCPQDELDVNVSPTKSQVKFVNPSLAFRAVQRAVRGVLEKAPWLEGLLSNGSGESPQLRTQYQSLSAEGSTENIESFSFLSPEMSQVQYAKKNWGDIDIKVGVETTIETAATANINLRTQNLWGSLEVLGQAHLTYIITQKEDAILFIDQHAAHERVMFEKLMAEYKNNSIEVQSFLLPPVVRLSEESCVELLKISSNLEKMGLFIEGMGPDEVAVRAAPAIVQPEALKPLLEKLSQEYLERGESFQLEKIVGDLMATMACHSAIRAGQAMSKSEMVSLLQQMDAYPLSSFCPHGRPVYVEYPIRKLERDFGRIN